MKYYYAVEDPAGHTVETETNRHVGKSFDEFQRALEARFSFFSFHPIDATQLAMRRRMNNVLICVDDAGIVRRPP